MNQGIHASTTCFACGLPEKAQKEHPILSSIKGQPLRSKPTSEKATPAAELSPAEIERVAANRSFVLQHMPEFVDFIKELHAVGAIDGWRCVQNCRRVPRKAST